MNKHQLHLQGGLSFYSKSGSSAFRICASFKSGRGLSPLHEAQERLVPHHGQLPVVTQEVDKVGHKGVQYPVGEGVLLV
jgi:hypothetical protein